MAEAKVKSAKRLEAHSPELASGLIGATPGQVLVTLAVDGDDVQVVWDGDDPRLDKVKIADEKTKPGTPVVDEDTEQE